MRKVLGFIADSAWAWGILMCIIVMLVGCATFPLKIDFAPKPIQDVAYEIGYGIAIEIPDVAKEIIEHNAKADKTDLLSYWPSWKNYLEYRVKDPFLRIGIRTLLSTVEIKFQDQGVEQQIETIRKVLKGFVSGLQAGMDASSLPSPKALFPSQACLSSAGLD